MYLFINSSKLYSNKNTEFYIWKDLQQDTIQPASFMDAENKGQRVEVTCKLWTTLHWKLHFGTNIQASVTWPNIIFNKNKQSRFFFSYIYNTYWIFNIESYMWKIKTHSFIPPSNFYKCACVSVTIQFCPFPHSAKHKCVKNCICQKCKNNYAHLGLFYLIIWAMDW